MRRMRWRALVLAICFGLLSLCGLPREGAASPRFLPAEPPPTFGDPDTPGMPQRVTGGRSQPESSPFLAIVIKTPWNDFLIFVRLHLPTQQRLGNR